MFFTVKLPFASQICLPGVYVEPYDFKGESVFDQLDDFR